MWPNFELIQDFIVVLVTYKNEEDPIKTEVASVATILYVYFSDVQGQIIPLSEVGSGRNSNSSKLFKSISLLPTRMQKIQSK